MGKTFSDIYNWAMAHKWWVIGGVGGLLGLYLIYRNNSAAVTAATGTGPSGLSGNQAAVDAAALQANTQESAIAAQAQAANEGSADQAALIQAELQAAQSQASVQTTNVSTAAQTQQSIAALNDNTAIQLATIANSGTVAALEADLASEGTISNQDTTFAGVLNQIDAALNQSNVPFEQKVVGAQTALQTIFGSGAWNPGATPIVAA